MIRISRPAAALLALVMILDLATVVMTIGVIDLDPLAAFAAGRSHAKVAIIVGPVGGYTDYYRSLANEAAVAARQRSDDVETLYSPDATWAAARRVLEGASIVVYLGHGNGWPSPYRDSLFRPTQNGLGLNPVAGVDDSAHQYFGESYLARSIHLAPGAVVILSHLCYASGNPEPGGAEPSLSVARQRADNYAAGWVAAGAAAVIAEAHSGPAYYVRALLRGRGTIEQLWRAAPTFHDHVVTFDSARSDGVTVLLDPDGAKRGFNRSLALSPGVLVADVLRGAPPEAARGTSVTPTRGGSPDPPSLAALGARFGTPSLKGAPIAGSAVALTLPIDARTRRLLPAEVRIGTRWVSMAADGPAPDSGVGPGSAPSDAPQPGVDDQASAPITGLASNGPASGALDPPGVDLVEQEAPSTVVTTEPAVPSGKGSEAAVSVPDQPGLYRLVTTIHDGDGVAFDAETQDLIPALIVHVTGSRWVTYGIPDEIRADPGMTIRVRVRVANSGTEPWGERPTEDLVDPNATRDAHPPVLIVRWVALDDFGTSDEPGPPMGVKTAYVEPGRSTVLEVTMRAPGRSGRYLLVFDVRTSDGTSLASTGVPPGIGHVVVSPTGSPAPSPSSGPVTSPGPLPSAGSAARPSPVASPGSSASPGLPPVDRP